MKKKSIKRWITQCFIAILLWSIFLSTVADLQESYHSIMKQQEDSAVNCAKNVTLLLNQQWGLEELSRSTDSDAYVEARHVFQQFCLTYGLDYLYVYVVDPDIPSRYYILVGSSDEAKDSVVHQGFSLKKVSVSKLLQGEQALVEGSRQIQREYMDNQYGKVVTWLAPYVDSEGELKALIGMDYDISNVRQLIRSDFIINIVPVCLTILTGLLFLLFLVQRRIIVPIDALSDSMRLFAEDSRKKVEPLNIPRNDEIGEMASSFEKMTEDIRAYINNIEVLTQERLEIDVQMDIARRIQNEVVPEKMDLEAGSFCISAMTHPAKAVGGDFYDCFIRDEDSVVLFMGDVSGKGISAAIYMAMIKTVIREKLLLGLSPAEALNQTNEQLCTNNPEELFATAFAAVLKPSTGELLYANAGHTLPLLLKEDPAFFKPDSGIALGMFEDAELKDYTLRLPAGQGILLYTDGLTEAINPQKTFFGMDRLLDAAKGVSKEANPAKDAVIRISSAVNTFCEGNEPFDDMALMALFYRAEVWHTVPVELSSFEEIKKAVFSTAGETAKARRALLACEEALSNIVHYSGAANLAFACEKKDGYLRISFSDDGDPFDPTAARNEEKEFELLDGGGMGLKMIRQSTSSLNYERKNGRNVFTLLFAL